MSYTVRLKRSAEKDMERLPARVQDKVVSVLISLKEEPLPVGAMKLQGRDGYRIRVGDYRILYIVDEPQELVEVLSVAHRKDAYR
ncbi:MAG: type II toxin-antitoxin system RelE/ParE family toxin [Nitrospirae bacterium]|nr:type II toxin-antitoxin system RelE/ParE family toxin [Nitrospirota bacterium]